MKQESNLGLHYDWQAGEVYSAQMDANWLILSLVTQTSVSDWGANDPTFNYGGSVIVGDAGTGEFAGKKGWLGRKINGAWVLINPLQGWRCDHEKRVSDGNGGFVDVPVTLRYAGGGVWEEVIATADVVVVPENVPYTQSGYEPGFEPFGWLYDRPGDLNFRFRMMQRRGLDWDIFVPPSGDAVTLTVNGLNMLRLVGEDAVGIPGFNESWELLGYRPVGVNGSDKYGFRLRSIRAKYGSDIQIRKVGPQADGSPEIFGYEDTLYLDCSGIKSLIDPTPADPIGMISLMKPFDIATGKRTIKGIKAGANVTIEEADGILTFSATGGGGGTLSDIGQVIDAILTDGNDVLLGADGSVLYKVTV